MRASLLVTRSSALVKRPLSLRSSRSLHIEAKSQVNSNKTAIHDGLLESGDELLSFDELTYKETIRTKRANRQPYTFAAWVRHRSDDRYLRYLKGIPTSEVLLGVIKPTLFFTLIAALYGVYYTEFDQHILPDWVPLIKFSPEVFTLTTPVLSFLLVFRTNASFQRWEEGRVELADIVRGSRELTRMALTHFEDERLRDALLRWLQAFVWSFKVHVRPGEVPDLEYRIKDRAVLLPEEYARLEEAEHRPQHCLMMLSRIVALANLPPPLTAMCNQPITLFQTIVANSERNLRYPLFIPYTRNTLRFLMGWLAFLPFALFPVQGWYAVPATAAISALLLGIEELGTQIEEPLSVLPVEQMAVQVTANCSEMKVEFLQKGPIFKWEADVMGSDLTPIADKTVENNSMFG